MLMLSTLPGIPGSKLLGTFLSYKKYQGNHWQHHHLSFEQNKKELCSSATLRGFTKSVYFGWRAVWNMSSGTLWRHRCWLIMDMFWIIMVSTAISGPNWTTNHFFWGDMPWVHLALHSTIPPSWGPEIQVDVWEFQERLAVGEKYPREYPHESIAWKSTIPTA